LKAALSHIATIQAGVFAQPEKQGDIFYLQAKHFNEEGSLNQLLYPELKVSRKIEKFLLQDGDILFAAKGAKNFAVVYQYKFGPAVASQTFLVARLNRDFRSVILPEYLAWFINNPQSLNKLKAAATGTSIQLISSSVFKDMEVDVPSIEKQRKILKIYELRAKEINLQMQVQALREILIQTQLLNATLD